jgi:rod shape-determining protein MreC
MSSSRDDIIIAMRYALLKKGAKQKFSLFFLISFSILIITLDKFSITPLANVRSILNDFVYRVTIIASFPERVLSYLSSSTLSHFSIYSETKNLKEEVERLKKSKFDSLYLKTENENLKLVLGLQENFTTEENKAIVAKVLIDQASPYLKSLIVSKGTKHGVTKGMTVFSKNYLIGTIIETNYLSSRVLLITDLNSKVPTIIEGTNVNSILSGTGNKNNFILEYLPENFVLEPNKVIYTSGKDGFLATGMPVAETYLNKKNKIQIKALGDPQQASIVFITKGNLKN